MTTIKDWKRHRAARRLKPGDGRTLQPFRWWHLLTGRKLFLLPADASQQAHAVDVCFWGRQGGDAGKAHLFIDGHHHAESTLPAAFPIADGTIEVAMSGFGLKRLHHVGLDGSERQLIPEPKSAAGRRLDFEREHPTGSRAIAAVSIVLLAVGIGLNVLQLLEPASRIPPLLERFGPFESPIALPLWLNLSLAFGAAMASMERGLRLRYHWLLDAAGN